MNEGMSASEKSEHGTQDMCVALTSLSRTIVAAGHFVSIDVMNSDIWHTIEFCCRAEYRHSR